MTRAKLWPSVPFLCALIAVPAEAQIDLYPPTVKPAAWERFALRAVNQTDTAFVAVRLTVPEAVMVLGIEPLAGWEARLIPSGESTPQAIEWTGGELVRGEFLEFAFFGRIPGDARRQPLVFPVHLTRATGSVVEWDRGGSGAAPTVRIIGTTSVTAWASLALAGVATGLAALALAMALAKRREAG
jgi:uncharacterized protein YcnI